MFDVGETGCVVHEQEKRESTSTDVRVESVGPEGYEAAFEIVALAFEADPGFVNVARGSGELARRRIHAMIRTSCSMHVLGGGGIRGAYRDGELLGVTLAEDPGASLSLPAAIVSIGRLLAAVGVGATYRSLRAALATLRARPPEPHHFLSMIAVHPCAHGRGLGGVLLRDLHAACDAHPRSRGVFLDTSNPKNISLYEHFGYRVVSTLPIPDVAAWAMFRPKGG